MNEQFVCGPLKPIYLYIVILGSALICRPSNQNKVCFRNQEIGQIKCFVPPLSFSMRRKSENSFPLYSTFFFLSHSYSSTILLETPNVTHRI